MHAQTRPYKDEETRMDDLQSEISALQVILCEKDAEAIVKAHIQLLHEYNEAKDATQILIGKLAVLKETTIKQLHENYGLTAED